MLKNIFLTFFIYGLSCFFLLFFFKELPKDFRGAYFTFYTFFEYSIFAILFYFNLGNKFFKRIIIIASVCFLIFQCLYLLTTEIQSLDSVPIGIETILIFIYIFCFFYESSKLTKDNYIYNQYCFWIAVGILIYLGGSFFFYILIDHLDKAEIDSFGNLTFLAEIIKNILFSVAILIYARQPKKTSKKPPTVPYLDMI